jgi:PAS domain S-box-containing protein
MNLPANNLHRGLQAVLDTALDPVVVMDCSGNIIGWNGHAEVGFGWKAEEVIGKRLSAFIVPPSYRDAHERGLAKYLATGDAPVLNRRIEVSAVDRHGNEFPIELSVAPTEQFGEKLFIGFLRDIRERHEKAERQQRLLQESDHRVKNMLTVVGAIAQQTARNAPDLQTFLSAFNGRLDALARAHQLLVGKVWQDVAITALAERVLGTEVAEGRARFGGPELLLGAQQVLGLSMILHELYTNAVKYGALCSDDGLIDLDWTVADGQVEMRWKETGEPCERESFGTGFGERMILMSVKSDLGGTLERQWNPEGLTAILRFPVNP